MILLKLPSLARSASEPLMAYNVAGSVGTSTLPGLSKMLSMLGNLRHIFMYPTNSAAGPSPTAPLKHSYSASGLTMPSTADTPSTQLLGVAFLGR